MVLWTATKRKQQSEIRLHEGIFEQSLDPKTQRNQSVSGLEHFDESILRDVDLADGFHFLFALFLLF